MDLATDSRKFRIFDAPSHVRRQPVRAHSRRFSNHLRRSAARHSNICSREC